MPNPADEKIAAATALLAIAEKELGLALAQLDVQDRADKRMVNLVVQAALQKLEVARANLEEARALTRAAE